MAKFSRLREFRPKMSDLNEVVRYLTQDVVATFKDLTSGLGKLSFDDNFEGWSEEVTIPASSELGIVNRLNPIIPTQRIIVRGSDGAESIVDGDTEWTRDLVYLKNLSGSPVTVTVRFLR